MGIFSCPCCVCVVGVCVSGGSRGLLKLSQLGSYWQAWKILASLENTGSGVGGGAVWQAERCWGICFSENNGGTGGCSHKRITAGQRWYRGMF